MIAAAGHGDAVGCVRAAMRLPPRFNLSKHLVSGQSNGADVSRKILIMGLPGAGKTTLANALAPLLNAVVFNADAVRVPNGVVSNAAACGPSLWRALGFPHDDRSEPARRMGWMCDRVTEAGCT